MPFSSRPRACREPSGHSVSVALPLHIHHPAVEPVLHAPDHPLPPPPRAGLAEGVCAVCVLRWLGPGHRTGESRGRGAPPQLIPTSVRLCQDHRERAREPSPPAREQQRARSRRLRVLIGGRRGVCIRPGPPHHRPGGGGRSGAHLARAPCPLFSLCAPRSAPMSCSTQTGPLPPHTPLTPRGCRDFLGQNFPTVALLAFGVGQHSAAGGCPGHGGVRSRLCGPGGCPRDSRWQDC